MSQSDSSLRAPVADVLAAVQSCVDARGTGVASVTTTVEHDLVTVAVTPNNPKAAAVTVIMGSDDRVLLTFGRTAVEIDEAAEPRLERLRTTLRLVFEGAFVEYGPGHAQSQFRLPSGAKVRVGVEKSPLQRRFGPKHRYEPYD